MNDQHNVSPQNENSIPEDSSWQQSFKLKHPKNSFWTDAAPEAHDSQSTIGNAEAHYSFDIGSGGETVPPMALSFKPASLDEAVPNDSFHTNAGEYPIRTVSASNIPFGSITKFGDPDSEPVGIQNSVSPDQNSENYKILPTSADVNKFYQTDGNSDYHHYGADSIAPDYQRVSDFSHQYPLRALSSDSSDIHFGNRSYREAQSSSLHQNADNDSSFETSHSDLSKLEESPSIDLGCETTHPDTGLPASWDGLPTSQALHPTFPDTFNFDPLQNPSEDASVQDIDSGT